MMIVRTAKVMTAKMSIGSGPVTLASIIVHLGKKSLATSGVMARW